MGMREGLFRKVLICSENENLAECWQEGFMRRKKICYIFYIQFDAILARANGKADGMEQLIQVLKNIRQKVPAYRRRPLKEDNTRRVIIDPLLEVLGWNVRDLDQVQTEYPTIDGKSVDYALKINKKVVLLVEAKALNDPLTDVKAITQVVGYAANNGIEWCVLTNGVKWKIYRSIEPDEATKKLMFEVDIEEDEKEGMSVKEIADRMQRLSFEEIAKGVLDELGERIFTDNKVCKALTSLLSAPPRSLLKMIGKSLSKSNLSAQQIKNSLSRIVAEIAWEQASAQFPTLKTCPEGRFSADSGMDSRAVRKTRAKKGESPSNEEHHIAGKSQEAIHLYRAVDRLCRGFAPDEIRNRFLKKYINYEYQERCFCSMHIYCAGLLVWLRQKYSQLEDPPAFARDVSNIGHWGNGDLELRITSQADMEEAARCIRQSFDFVRRSVNL